MGCLILVVGIIYVLSPIDLWPGILDDIAVIVLMIYLSAKWGINLFQDKEDSDSDEWLTTIALGSRFTAGAFSYFL